MSGARLQKWAMATLVATLCLIFIGGFVRVSGAGLGCPDWPRCWGHWWPPSGVEEIDASAYPVDAFNHTKMWIEYANRLVGVAVGLLVFGTLVLALRRWRQDRGLALGAFGAFVMVGFEGWLGGEVVKSELAGGMITLHLGGALVLFCLLLWITWRAGGSGRFEVDGEPWRRRFSIIAWASFVVSGVQILLGARVREAMDVIAKSGAEIARADWVEAVGTSFEIHRSFGWALVAVSVAVVWALVKSKLRGAGRVVAWGVPGMVGVQVASGLALAYLAMPPSAQVIHLGFSAVLCCVSFWMVLGFMRAPGGGKGVEP